MHKTALKLKFGDFFLNFWPHWPTEDKEIENKTQNIRQLGLSDDLLTVRHAVSPSPSVRAADCLPLWGDTAARPPSFGMPVRHSVAGHLSRASLELLQVPLLDVKRPRCLLEPLGAILEGLEPS